MYETATIWGGMSMPKASLHRCECGRGRVYMSVRVHNKVSYLCLYGCVYTCMCVYASVNVCVCVRGRGAEAETLVQIKGPAVLKG